MIKIGAAAQGIAVHFLRDGRAACDAAASHEMEWTHNDYTLTDDPDRIDFAELCSLLWGTYWAETRGREVIERSVRRSLSFALLRGGKLAGFARVVTDAATVGYLCDFVIGEAHRGAGIGQWMLTQILAHPDLRGCRIREQGGQVRRSDFVGFKGGQHRERGEARGSGLQNRGKTRYSRDGVMEFWKFA